MPIKVIKTGTEDKRQGCPKKGRIMGLDMGSKTIGVAISNDAQSIATPLITIKRSKFDSDMLSLCEVVWDFGIKSYLFGFPINMDGSHGPRCDATRSFADQMIQYSKAHDDVFGKDPWIGLWDERLSTQAVDTFVDSRVDMPKMARKGAKESGLTDKLAAQFILQGFLDSINA
ncbi:MAG: Holliday junction resolvase RuvX [Alphaproteobacteria bacterium]|nr:Holliday junction resolvase RuvX [Alphaproteobacteria bacterium]NCQ87871.1 Holliday junction resolvase RuvX [Alphaproteobacteria bacterium]NCT05621.1 Holliday junction resolvase RuvX [Alphaproteobacteria bacterium]